jgi:transcriptional regulator with GAF, ATPase, and Fis domain
MIDDYSAPNGIGLNANETLQQINEFNDSLNQTTQQLNELQGIWERTLQALNKRGIQIQIDFSRMLTGVRQQLERSQTLSNLSARRLMQFQELITTSALLTSSLEFEQVMEKVLDSVIKLTGAERVYLMLKHGDDPELKVQIARNAERHTLSTEDVTFSRGIIQTVIQGRAPLITTNAQSDERFSGLQSVIVNELRSIIIVPMFLKEQLIGVLYADNRIEQGVFNQEMTSILAAFANQAAIAISNARLFEKISAELKAAQNQVQALLNQIDYEKVQNKVVEITSSDYFQNIASRAKEMRKRNDKSGGEGGNP